MPIVSIFSPKGKKYRGSVRVESDSGDCLALSEKPKFKIRKGDMMVYPIYQDLCYWQVASTEFKGLERG